MEQITYGRSDKRKKSSDDAGDGSKQKLGQSLGCREQVGRGKSVETKKENDDGP